LIATATTAFTRGRCLGSGAFKIEKIIPASFSELNGLSDQIWE